VQEYEAHLDTVQEPELTLEYLKSILHYNPATGKWIWLKRVADRIHIGDEAGWINSSDYRVIKILYKNYFSHVLAWFYMKGEWSKKQIDHIDNNHSNNKWANLRESTPSQNQMNRPLKVNNNSGYSGVHYDKNAKRWRADITVEYKQIFLGRFINLEEAVKARELAEIKYFGEFRCKPELKNANYSKQFCNRLPGI
jgi:HNH endonuclease